MIKSELSKRSFLKSKIHIGEPEYIPGNVPTRDGLPIYDFSSSTFPRFWSWDFQPVTVEPHDGTWNNAIRHEIALASLHHPSPEEEYIRGVEMKKLRQQCEKISMKTLGCHLPKDLFDHCIFLESSLRQWYLDDSLNANFTTFEKESYKDPIFPRCNINMTESTIQRELFGEVISRPLNPQGENDPGKLLKTLCRTVEKSSMWIEKFRRFLTQEDGKHFIETFASPLDVLQRISNIMVESKQQNTLSNHILDEKYNNDADDQFSRIATLPPLDKILNNSSLDFVQSTIDPGWVSWMYKACRMIKDIGYLCLRLQSSTEEEQQYDQTILSRSRTSQLIAQLILITYPLAYGAVSDATRQILLAMETYDLAIKEFVQDERHRNNSDAFNVKTKSSIVIRKHIPTDPNSTTTSSTPVKITKQSLSNNLNYNHRYSFWQSEISIIYKDDELRCRRAHFEKYKFLYELASGKKHQENANLPAAAFYQPSQPPSPGEVSLMEVEEDELCKPLLGLVKEEFKRRLYVMLKRYENIIYNPSHHTTSGNMHAAAPEKVFHFLKATHGVQFECFASPNNCFFPRYFSAFPDADAPFGATGSFFDRLNFPSGAYEVGPPYTEEMLLRTADHVEKIMKNTQNAITMFAFVPDWSDSIGVQRMAASPFCVGTVQGSRNEHVYVIGIQHRVLPGVPKHYYCPQNVTLCFIFQSPKAQNISPIESHFLCELQARMSDQMTLYKEKVLPSSSSVAPTEMFTKDNRKRLVASKPKFYSNVKRDGEKERTLNSRSDPWEQNWRKR